MIPTYFLILLFGVQLRMPLPLPVLQDHPVYAVTVLIKDVQPDLGGELLVALLNDAGKQMLSARLPVTGSQGQVVFKPVTSGTYAVRYFQDTNANGKVDKGWFNIPDEGVGCSNDAKGFLSAPDLKDMLFRVDRSTTIESHIHYY